MPMAMLPKHDLDRRAVPMPQVLDLVEALQQRGHPLNKILRETGLVESDLANLELRVSYRQRIQQLEDMLALAGTDGFG